MMIKVKDEKRESLNINLSQDQQRRKTDKNKKTGDTKRDKNKIK